MLSSNPNNTLGPLLMGIVFSSMLYGVTSLQVYSYFTHHCEKDRPFLKIFVVTLLILGSLQLALVIHAYYVISITNFGNFYADLSDGPPWSYRLHTLFAILLVAATQQFYAWRIFKLSMGKIYIPILIVAITLLELVVGIGFVFKCFQKSSCKEKVLTPYTISFVSSELACDMIITSSMVYYLVMRSSKVKRSNTSPARTLALYCINSGFLVVVFAALTLVTFVCYPYTTMYAPFFSILVHLYSCSFMAILNSRDHLRNAVHTSTAFATFSVSLAAPTTRPGATQAGNTTSNVGHGTVGLNKFFKKMTTLRSTEDGGISNGTSNFAAADRHKNKPFPLNTLPTSDSVVAPIPPLFDHSSGLTTSHV
ncbi:hypothetical protein BGW80DRAFT_638372 [Lactifluus volemus]|nr:hypothetical protein BGW80DRAFT_638372 [Lactifluus volemus]